MTNSSELVSIVIPVYNNRDGLKTTHSEIKTVLLRNNLRHEIIFVDDGSQDGSFSEIESLVASDPDVIGIRFSRNFGQHSALLAGLKKARGNVMVTIDADLQNDPEDIPLLINKLNEGYQVVSGWRDLSHVPWLKRLRSRTINWCIYYVTGLRLRDSTATFKAYSREIIQSALKREQFMKFLPIYVCWIGSRVTEIKIHYRKRRFGKSQYQFLKLVELFFEWLLLFTSGMKMVILLLAMGLLSLCFSFLFLGVFFLRGPSSMAGAMALIYAFIAFMGGLNFLIFGVLFERIKQIQVSVNSQPLYIIDTVISHDSIVHHPAK